MPSSSDPPSVDDVGVEVFVASSSSSMNPVILPPRTGMGLTAAQKRWKLLKTMQTVTRRLNSLTQREKELFVETKCSSSAGPPSTCPRLKEAREVLQSRLEEHKTNRMLTGSETKFLEELVESPHVTAEDLHTTVQVLHQDPLYQKEDKHDGEEKEDGRRKKKMDHSESFRREIWTHFSSSSASMSSSLRSTKEREKEEEKEKEDDKEEEPDNFVYRFFFGRGHGDEDKKEEKEDDHPDMDEDVHFTILGTSATDEDCSPHVLSPPIMDSLRPHLPFVVQQDNFWLKYSLLRDGASLRTLLRKVRSSSRTVLAIETMDGDVFGAFVSSPWRVVTNTRDNNSSTGGYFYGSGEAFLWRLAKPRVTPTETLEEQIHLESTTEIFVWTGKNRNVQACTSLAGELVVGGGGLDSDDEDRRGESASGEEKNGSGITLRADLERGFSDPCLTFGCPPLPTCGKDRGVDSDPFEIANVEVWALTPVADAEQAEKLELGRQFVFDHGNFAMQ